MATEIHTQAKQACVKSTLLSLHHLSGHTAATERKELTFPSKISRKKTKYLVHALFPNKKAGKKHA
jgi:hypothetical protein